MFHSTLFDDVNKTAYDVLRDGYCDDVTMALKYSTRGVNMTLEGRSTGATTSGKVSCSFRSCDYLDVKKLALENSGLVTLEADLPKLLKCSTLQVRLQQDVFKLAPKKLAVGMKFLGETHAANFMFDATSLSYSVGVTRCFGNVIAGLRIAGDQESAVGSVDSVVAYRYKDVVFSAGLNSFATVLSGAISAKPFRNVEFGTTVDIPFEKKGIDLAFGFRMHPDKRTEAAMKVDSRGVISGYFKKSLARDMTIAGTASMPMNSTNLDNCKVGLSMEMRIWRVCCENRCVFDNGVAMANESSSMAIIVYSHHK